MNYIEHIVYFVGTKKSEKSCKKSKNLSLQKSKSKLFSFLQSMETVQKVLEPQQDAILRMAKLEAVLNEGNKTEAAAVLLDMRLVDKTLRERLFILQVWKKFDYETAHKVSRKKAGDYADPELSKVLEEREKREEKQKRDRERERAHSSTPYNNKRGRYEGNNYSSSYNSNGGRGGFANNYRSPGGANNYSNRGNNHNYKRNNFQRR